MSATTIRTFTSWGGDLLFSLALLIVLQPAFAEYPERPVRAVVPFDTGGPIDVIARLVSPLLGKALGQPVYVENRPGAAGNIGTETVVKSPPNGYAILYSASAATQNPALFRNLRFDPLKDVQPVVEISTAPYVMVVNPVVPAKSPMDLISYARKNPGKLNAVSGGIGTRLSVELFQLRNQIKVEIIPYGGTGPAALAVLKGEGDFAIMDVSPFIPHIASGRVRALMVAGDRRLAFIPNVPTAREAGLSDYKAGISVGMYVAAGTQPAIVQKLYEAVSGITKMPEVADKLQAFGAYPSAMTHADFSQWYVQEIQTWKDIVAKAKIPAMD